MGSDPSGHLDLVELAVTGGIIGGLNGAVVGGIRGGFEGAVRGAALGALYGAVAGAAVFGGGLALSGLSSLLPFAPLITPAVGQAIIGGTLTAYFGVENLFTLANSNDPKEQLIAGVNLATLALSWYAAKLSSPDPGPSMGGRLGIQSTRTQLSMIANYLKAGGWTVTGGGGVLPEEYLPPNPSAGAPNANYVDATFTKSGKVLRIQTVTCDTQGNPTPDEASAASSIRAKTPGDHLLLIPKEPQ